MLKKLSSLFGIFAISFAFVGCEPQTTETEETDTTTEMPGDSGVDAAPGDDTATDDSAEPAGDDESTESGS